MSLVGVSDPSLRAVEEYYIAYFGRPGDVPGATFWGSAVDAAGGPTTTAGKAVLDQISADFSGSPEYSAFKAGKTNQKLVEAIYQNVLHRAGDASGVEFWTKALDAGTITVDNVVIEILKAAKNNTGTDDAQTINNLTDVAVKFTSELSVSPLDSAQYIADSFQQGFGVLSSTNHDEQLDYTIAHTGEVVAVGTSGSDSVAADGTYVKDDEIIGFDFNDLISGLSGHDTLSGLGGNDTIFGGSGVDTISGGEGDDSLYGGTGNDDIDGNNGNDLIRGEDGNDHLDGGNGDDAVYGDAGNDIVTGNTGSDNLFGGAGNDVLSGGSENDTLDGGTGSDTLLGGSGHDVLTGGVNTTDATDVLSGGSGNDDFIFTNDGVVTFASVGGAIGSGNNTNTTSDSYVSIPTATTTGLETLDKIVDLNLGDLSGNAIVDQINPGVNYANLLTSTNFIPTVQAAVTDAAALKTAYDAALTVGNTTAAIVESTTDGKAYLIFDYAADGLDYGVAATGAGGDLVIDITGYQGTLDASDFFG